MKSFKEFFITEMAKKKKKKKPIEMSFAKGEEFGMVGAGRSGIDQKDKKGFNNKKDRRDSKKELRNY